MKKHLLIPFVFILLLLIEQGRGEFLFKLPVKGIEPYNVDVLQIDSGNSIELKGHVHIPESKGFIWHPHGTLMAEALKNAADKYKSPALEGIQLIYEQKSAHSVIEAIKYGFQFNPKVLSLSLAGKDRSSEEEAVIEEASRRDILILAASGNHGDEYDEYPAAYNIPCLISVSTLQNGKKAYYAHRGQIYLEQLPGENGTSFSTARAAGIAAVVRKNNPKATCLEVKRWMIKEFGSAR